MSVRLNTYPPGTDPHNRDICGMYTRFLLYDTREYHLFVDSLSGSVTHTILIDCGNDSWDTTLRYILSSVILHSSLNTALGRGAV